jgi:hypothetical protein
MITPTLGFCATLFDPVHDIVAVGPFANSIGHFLRAGFRRVVLSLLAYPEAILFLVRKFALCICYLIDYVRNVAGID